MSVAFFILISATIIAYSLAPLLRPREQWLSAINHGARRRQLEAEKESHLRAMQDVEFEHASNKINDHDYDQLRQHYGNKAAATIQALNQLVDDKPATATLEKAHSCEAEDLSSQVKDLQAKIADLEKDRDSGLIGDEQYCNRHAKYNEELHNINRANG